MIGIRSAFEFILATSFGLTASACANKDSGSSTKDYSADATDQATAKAGQAEVLNGTTQQLSLMDNQNKEVTIAAGKSVLLDKESLYYDVDQDTITLNLKSANGTAVSQAFRAGDVDVQNWKAEVVQQSGGGQGVLEIRQIAGGSGTGGQQPSFARAAISQQYAAGTNGLCNPYNAPATGHSSYGNNQYGQGGYNDNQYAQGGYSAGQYDQSGYYGGQYTQGNLSSYPGQSYDSGSQYSQGDVVGYQTY